VYRGETIYDGTYINEAPDLVIDQRPGVHIAGGIGRGQVFTEAKSDGWLAENKRPGLFAATGPDFSTGELEKLSILDLAPTILHLHNCEVPSDMDGQVIKSVFSSNSDARTREINHRTLTGRDKEIKRIRKVGRQIDL